MINDVVNNQLEVVRSPKQLALTQANSLIRRGLDQLAQTEPRVVHFPTNCSLGTLHVVDDDVDIWEKMKWEKIAEAKGEVHIQPRKKLILEVANGEREFELTLHDDGYFYDYQTNQFVDQSPFALLKPNDLQGLKLGTRLNWLPAKPGASAGLAFISRLTGLEWLSLSDCPIDNLNFLENLQALKGLEISGSNLYRIAPIHKLTSLRYLALEWTEFFDFEYLEDLVNLEILHVGVNEDLLLIPGWSLWEVNLDWLANMPNLQLLDLHGLDLVSNVTVQDIEEKICAPNCAIWV